MASSGSESDGGVDVDLSDEIRKLRQEQKRQRFEGFCVHCEIQEYCEEHDGSTIGTSVSEVGPMHDDGMRPALGKNKSFTAFEVREIERNNANLVKKIASHNSRKSSQFRNDTGYYSKVWNSQVNRRKKQQQIDRENMILLKKIQGVKASGLSNWKKTCSN